MVGSADPLDKATDFFSERVAAGDKEGALLSNTVRGRWLTGHVVLEDSVRVGVDFVVAVGVV